ncbi:MAG: translation initiation factor IF-2 subunit beta [Candidatus Aenigmarchaeota archaeon]|nr:translation initiation factor IF-2 subunit beta [Candidatus Aenigmarchaeota archaeon]
MDFSYESLLKSAMEKVPKREGSGKRFKVPQVVVEAQGAKTVIKNMAEVASGLRREPEQVGRFIAKEMAAPGSIQNGTFVLQAKASKEMLQRKLEDYIKNFVYCRVCGEPDTKLEKDDRIVFIRCEACGARSAAKPV